MYKIAIDAGHYGNYYNKGVIDGYYESNMTWELQGYLKEELESYGFEVGTTRVNKAEDLEVSQRGLRSLGYDLFISLHSNAASSESPDYVAVFHLADDKTTRADDVSKVLAKKLAPVIAETMHTSDEPKVLDRPVAFDRDGDGQLNDNYYGVLHGADLANTPGIIIEHSFHTNKKACAWLMNSAHLMMLAKAEAEVIAEFFGMKKKQEETKEEPKEEDKEDPSPKGFYRVVAGSFRDKEKAQKQLEAIQAAGFSGLFLLYVSE